MTKMMSYASKDFIDHLKKLRKLQNEYDIYFAKAEREKAQQRDKIADLNA